MFKNLLFAILFFFTHPLHAQLKLGLQAGYNSAKWNYTITPGNWETTTDAIGGFNAGALAQYELKSPITLQASLLFNSGGTKHYFRYRFNSGSREIKTYSLNLPLVAMYTIDVKKLRFGIGGGFYAAYIISGTEKGTAERFIINGPPEIQTIDNKIEFGSSGQYFDPSSNAPIHLERFDAGYVVLTSIQYNRKIIFQTSYNGGLREVLPDGYFFSGNFKTSMVSLSLAIFLR